MYKTISIQNTTYQNLQAISAHLEKPKSQVIDDLINKYNEKMEAAEEKKLQEYNNFVAKLADGIKLPEGTKIKSEDLDKDFSVLKDEDF